jgi:hypothetical protein
MQQRLRVETKGILRRAQGRGDIKAHPKGAQLGAQQVSTNSVAISIQHALWTPPRAAAEICVSVVDEVVRLTEVFDGLASVSLFLKSSGLKDFPLSPWPLRMAPKFPGGSCSA